MIARPFGKPGFDRRRLVGRVIVHDQMDIEIGRHGSVDGIEEAAETRLRGGAPVAAAEHPALPDGAGAKFVVTKPPSFFTRPFSSNARRESMSASAATPQCPISREANAVNALNAAGSNRNTCIVRDSQHNKQSYYLDPVPNGWRQSIR